MAQFSLSPGPEFTGQEAVIMAADGSVTTLPIPFGRGTMGDAVKEIALPDKLLRRFPRVCCAPLAGRLLANVDNKKIYWLIQQTLLEEQVVYARFMKMSVMAATITAM